MTLDWYKNSSCSLVSFCNLLVMQLLYNPSHFPPLQDAMQPGIFLLLTYKGTTSVVKKRTVEVWSNHEHCGIVGVKIELRQRADSWWIKYWAGLLREADIPVPLAWEGEAALVVSCFFSNGPYINDANTVATEYRFYSTHGVRRIRTSNGAALSGSHSLRCHMHGNRNSRDLFFLSLVVLSF